MRHPEFVITFLFLLLAGACKHPAKIRESPDTPAVAKTEGSLGAIDFTDPAYQDLALYAKDTILQDGWVIQYLVRNDSTKHQDIYLRCGKSQASETYFGAGLLEVRRYFIPRLEAETKSFLFFGHGCATDCSALLVFSKDSPHSFQNFENVVGYDPNNAQILQVTDSSYEHEDRSYDLRLVDLLHGKTHRLTYRNICRGVYKPACVDTVLFGKSRTLVKTTLERSLGNPEKISKTRAVDL